MRLTYMRLILFGGQYKNARVPEENDQIIESDDFNNDDVESNADIDINRCGEGKCDAWKL